MAEARMFLERARNNETVQAVRRAAVTLGGIAYEKIEDLTRASRNELAVELLRYKLERLFLDELLK